MSVAELSNNAGLEADVRFAPPDAPQLWLPANENATGHVEISIVVPALNEQVTISEFVDWCWQGLRDAGVTGEVIIVDSSTDETPHLALAKGARVLRTPKRGLGHAYIDAIPFIRGDFVIMGDCDLTYDFREIKAFVDAYRSGAQFVMGSRFRGHIEPGAMPALHRYFGTPLTTWILNGIYRSRYSDIHCGMRGLTMDSLRRMGLTSKGWEYASEMVLKASRLRLRIAEVPVRFYKDRDGRLSHHRRAGFWSPWFAGWINLKIMLVYSPDSFLLKPGLVLFLLGFLLSSWLATGSRSLGSLGFDLHWMLLGVTLGVLGFALFQVGIIARIIHGLRAGLEKHVLQVLSYDRGIIAAGVVFGLGALLDLNLVLDYFERGFRLETLSHPAIYGLFLIMLAAQLFGFTLLLELFRRTTLHTPTGHSGAGQ
jgi:glycosyltransferase involved in cell wall biosynthesis